MLKPTISQLITSESTLQKTNASKNNTIETVLIFSISCIIILITMGIVYIWYYRNNKKYIKISRNSVGNGKAVVVLDPNNTETVNLKNIKDKQTRKELNLSIQSSNTAKTVSNLYSQ